MTKPDEDDEDYCEVCGELIDDCICHEEEWEEDIWNDFDEVKEEDEEEMDE